MKRKILIIIPWLPYPLSSGGHQALYNGIVAIMNDFDVSIAYERYQGDDEAELHFREKYPNITLLPIVYPQIKFKNKLANWFHGLISVLFKEKVSLVDQMCDRWIMTVSPLKKEFVRHVDRICRDNVYDIIQVEMPWFISLVLTLPKSSKKVYVHHELGFVCRELESAKYVNDAYVDSCKNFADMTEIKLLNLYDRIIALSSVDANKLKKCGVSVPVETSFAVLCSNIGLENKACDGFHLVFVGPDSHMPNYVGLLWFLDNCWNSLKRINPHYHLSVIGKWSESHIHGITSKYNDVEFLGFVDNLQANINGTVMIVPITIGSGIRMKILEACSMGIPFVSTYVGAEGIPVVNGEHCLLADTAEIFMDSIIKLQNKEIQERLVKNAQKMYQNFYSLGSLRNNRIHIYDDLLKI